LLSVEGALLKKSLATVDLFPMNEVASFGHLVLWLLLAAFLLAATAGAIDLVLGIVGIDLLGNDHPSCAEIKLRDGPYARCY
jgi:hypothetical protein